MYQFFAPEKFGIRQAIQANFLANSEMNEFTDLGIGKPLVVRFHTLHVGDLKNGWFNNRQSILITSLIKDDITYGIPSRGVHQVYTKAKDRQTLHPEAIHEGTELIYYSDAFDSGKLKFTIEVQADRFNQEIMDTIGDSLGHASGLPVFAPYAPYLLAGNHLLKAAGNIVNRIMEKIPMVSYSFDVENDLGGSFDTKAGFLIGGNEDELSLLSDQEIMIDSRTGKVFLGRGGQKYKGDIPYVIISLDGKANIRYKNFKATIASAALLKKFHGLSSETFAGDVQDILLVYNDYSYIQKIKDARDLIGVTNDPQKREDLEKLIEAYKRNVQNKQILKMLEEEQEQPQAPETESQI